MPLCCYVILYIARCTDHTYHLSFAYHFNVSYSLLHFLPYQLLNTYTHAFTYEHIHTYTYLRTHTYIYIHTHMYTHTHMHTHTHMYTYIHKTIEYKPFPPSPTSSPLCIYRHSSCGWFLCSEEKPFRLPRHSSA